MLCIYALILSFSKFYEIGCWKTNLQLILDMCFAAKDAALCADSQLDALKYVHCQKLHVDTTPTTITSKHICKCSVCNKVWYES